MLIDRPNRNPEQSSPPSDKVQRIVEAAASVMRREGYAGTSMKDIAREAGIAQGLIHYYFSSKDDLVMAVLRQACAEMLAETQAAFQSSTGGPLERITPTLAAARERSQHRPEMWRLFFELLPLSFNNPRLRAQFQEVYAKIVAGTLEMIEEVNRQVPVPLPVNAEYFARVITATIDGLAVQVLVEPGLDVEGLYTAFAFVLLSTVAGSFAVAGQPVPTLSELANLLAGPAGAG
ncbi:MAG: TetR/AcrR family transcriptional regulator [Candidatus Dormibacteria bacterium]